MTQEAEIDEASEAQKMIEDWIATKDEPLHPDLVPYVGDTMWGRALRHPLVYDVPMFSHGMANKAYTRKRELLAEALAEEKLHSVVFLHERAWRTTALIQYVLGEEGRAIDASDEVRQLIVEVWTDSENIHQHIDDWAHIISGWEPGDPLMFANEKEREQFKELPDEITLWRGDCDDGGWSWTTERDIAEFFARRFANKVSDYHKLLTGTVGKRDVFGYITRRNESEVMVLHEHVRDIQVVEL